MDVKKAIRFISKHIADFKERTEGADDKEGCKKLIKEGEGVIELLQQGENYKEYYEKCKSDFGILVKRWDELYEENKISKKYREIVESIEWHIKTSKEINPEVYGWLKFIERIIEKHFPKEVKSNGR